MREILTSSSFFVLVQMMMMMIAFWTWIAPILLNWPKGPPPWTVCWSKLKVNTPSGFFAHDPKGFLCVKIPPWASGLVICMSSGRICCSSYLQTPIYGDFFCVYIMGAMFLPPPSTIWKICDVYCGINCTKP
jgi:hypothetical protein